jgi:casein kinase 1
MNYVRKLGFEESPDYDFLRDLFSKVLKTTGEQDDGIYDWMLLNNGKGWEAGHVRPVLSYYPENACSLPLKTPSQILAQAHANAGTPQTPQREPREHRSRDHRRVSRQAMQEGNPLTSPNPAHLKVSTRRTAGGETPRGVSRDTSGQPIPPSSKRASQQHLSPGEIRAREPSNGISAHPYAVAPSPGAFRGSPYGNGIPGTAPQRPESALAAGSTGALGLAGNGNGAANSDSFLYGSTAKRAEEAAAAAAREGRANGMAVYDRGQVSRGGIDPDDELGGHRRGLFGFLCCHG